MALSTKALTTVARVQVPLGSVDSAVLEPLIEEASEYLMSLCNRNLYYATGAVEYVAGFGDRKLTLKKHVPLLSLSSIVYDPDDANETIDATDYAILGDGNPGWVHRINGNWLWTATQHGFVSYEPLAGTELPLYKVTYTGGYVTPQQVADAVATPRTLPYDIERAVVDLVVALYRRSSRDPSLVRKQVSRAMAEWRSMSDISSVQAVVAKYGYIA